MIHPFTESPKHTYQQICVKVCRWYGVKDAEHWYRMERKRISDTCSNDFFGIKDFDTIASFWADKQLRWKWSDRPMSQDVKTPPDVNPAHTVDLYSVRGAGSNGEIGVLTTAHDLETFVIGLSRACANLIKSDSSDTEHQLRWIFKNAFPVAFKLAGYKADQVVERHVLMCGSSAPATDDIVASA